MPSRAVRPATLATLAAIALGGAGGARAQPPPRPARTTGAAAPAAAAAVTPAAAGLARLRAVLATTMAAAGPQAGALVVDLASGRELFSLRPDTRRVPASVEKLYTTAAALARFGPDARLRTTIMGAGAPDARGVWHGDLYLRGGGDPTFGSRGAPGGDDNATALATALFSATGILRVDGSVIGDESTFDDRRGEPASGYRPDPDLAGQLSGLAYDHGRTGGLPTPAAYAAQQMAGVIRTAGVPVTGPSTAGRVPPAARVLAAVSSPPLRTLVGLTDVPSDNFYAETLLKDLGARFGAAGSTAAGAAVVRGWLAGLGIAPHIVDGSGLSHADRTTPRQLVALLQALHAGPLAPVGAVLLADLPIVGRTGTLVHRMRGTPAAGRCAAKTGTLVGVSTLAGVCDGRFAFAFLMNAITDAKAHTLQDRMTVALAASG